MNNATPKSALPSEKCETLLHFALDMSTINNSEMSQQTSLSMCDMVESPHPADRDPVILRDLQVNGITVVKRNIPGLAIYHEKKGVLIVPASYIGQKFFQTAEWDVNPEEVIVAHKIGGVQTTLQDMLRVVTRPVPAYGEWNLVSD